MSILPSILESIQSAGGRHYRVGGCVRDQILGHSPKDVDIEVYGLPALALDDLLAKFGRVDQVGVSFGVFKLTTNDEDFDFSLPRRDSKAGAGHRGFQVEVDHTLSIAEASARRDYTINAISIGSDGQIIDPYNGQEDLRRRILRHTSPAFAEDPLRVLRGMQFAGRYGMTINRDTARLCRNLRPEYYTLAKERVWSEWHKWASKSAIPSKGLEFLYSSGWIYLYPELASLIGLPQEAEWHPEGSVWQHTKAVCDAAATIAQRDGLGTEDRATLLFGALCHDMGKATTTEVINGRITSHGHDRAGVPFALSFMESIGAPRRLTEEAAELTQYHMAHVSGNPSPRVARRLAANMKSATPGMLIRLIEADHSGRPPLPGGLPPSAQALGRLLDEIGAKAEPILMGRHLVGIGMEPGPQFGEILRKAFDAQIEGDITSLEQAIRFAEGEKND